MVKLTLEMFGQERLKKALIDADKLKTKFEGIQDGLDSINNKFEAISDIGYVKALDKFQDKLISIVKLSSQMDILGGVTGVLKFKFSQLGSSMKELGYGGFLGAIKAIGLVFKSWFAPLIAITGIVYTFATVWRENIGGIQTLSIKFFGELKNAMAKFDVKSRQILRKLGPMFKFIFEGVFDFLSGTLEGLVHAFDGLLYSLNPIAEVVGKMFSIFNTDGKKGLGIMRNLGKVFGVLLGVILPVYFTYKLFTGAIAIYNTIMGIAAVKTFGIAVATKAATAAMWLFHASNPVGWIIIAVAALGAMVYYFEDIVSFLDNMGNKVKEWGSFLKEPLNTLGEMLGIMNLFDIVFDSLWKTTMLMLEPLMMVIEGIRSLGGLFGGDSSESVATDNAANVRQGGNNSFDNSSRTLNINSTKMDANYEKQAGGSFFTQSNKTGG